MEVVNTVLLVVGMIVSVIGVAALINPNFARLINAPGGPRLKGSIAIICGIIIIIVGIMYQFPN